MADSEAIARAAIEEMLRAIPGDGPRCIALARAVTDWPALIRVASAHGVAGVLWHELELEADRSKVQAVPPEARQAFEAERAAEQLRAEWLETILLDGLEALEAAGLRAVCLKGPILGRRLYPPGAPRPASDLDLLVCEHDLWPAVEALAAIGYEPDATVADDLFLEYHHHIHLNRLARRAPPKGLLEHHAEVAGHLRDRYRPVGSDGRLGPTIELHHRLFCGFGRTLWAEGFVERASEYLLPNGTKAFVLSPEDEVLYLALHATNHRFVRLGWLYDLKLLILAHGPALDWAKVRARARSLDVSAAVELGLRTLEERLEVVTFGSGENGAHVRAKLASLLLHPNAVRPSSPIAKASFLAFSMLLCDRPQDAVRWAGQRFSHFARREANRYVG